MSIAELTANIQFTIDQQGRLTAVVVQPLLWQRIIDALNESADPALVAALQGHGLAHPETAAQTGAATGASRLAQNTADLDDDMAGSAYATMLASEFVLRKDWDTPEEDAAWADL
jgi:hypothetical protein